MGWYSPISGSMVSQQSMRLEKGQHVWMFSLIIVRIQYRKYRLHKPHQHQILPPGVLFHNLWHLNCCQFYCSSVHEIPGFTERVLSTLIGWVGATPRSQYYIRYHRGLLRPTKCKGFECASGALTDSRRIMLEYKLCNILTFKQHWVDVCVCAYVCLCFRV